MPFLSVAGVRKSFSSPGGRREVLRDVSFSLAKGEVLCLLGPNGSGKTTLLKIIAGLLSPEAGDVFLDGAPLHRDRGGAAARLGWASTEDHSFYGRLSARGNLWFYGRLYGFTERRFAERLASVEKDLDLTPILDQPFRELSSGQKQRMLLARANLHDPDLLILDEPHQNMDPALSRRFRDVLTGEWAGRRGKTILVSTHHLEDAQKMSDRWVVLSQGRVRFAGSLNDERRRNPDFDVERFFQGLTETA
jgi:ABC-type multidrug transport system ATPase subunit